MRIFSLGVTQHRLVWLNGCNDNIKKAEWPWPFRFFDMNQLFER